jgi:hypothetical protein
MVLIQLPQPPPNAVLKRKNLLNALWFLFGRQANILRTDQLQLLMNPFERLQTHQEPLRHQQCQLRIFQGAFQQISLRLQKSMALGTYSRLRGLLVHKICRR